MRGRRRAEGSGKKINAEITDCAEFTEKRRRREVLALERKSPPFAKCAKDGGTLKFMGWVA
jgi:hypothetical protein